jgi:hypothetical protein
MSTLKSLDDTPVVTTEALARSFCQPPPLRPRSSRPRLEMRWDLDETGRPVCVWAAVEADLG